MKEKFIGKFHFIFYKNWDIYILPSINFVKNTVSSCNVLNFMWLRWRVTIFSDIMDRKVHEENSNMIGAIGLALTDVPESRWDQFGTCLRDVLAWWESYTKINRY